VEEEGTDNFANVLNARGTLDALARADQALAVALAFQEENPDTLVITASDSSAGSFDVLSLPEGKMERFSRLANDPSGALYTRPHDAPFYLSAPDKAGQRHPFLLAWASTYDLSGGIVVRAVGLNADRVRGSFDNTRIFSLVHQTLFGAMAQGTAAAH
jgi:alkaline phosphatase